MVVSFLKFCVLEGQSLRVGIILIEFNRKLWKLTLFYLNDVLKY